MEFLSCLKKSQRENYLTKAKMVHLKLYRTFIANIYHKNLPINSETIKKLKCYRKKISHICDKSTSLKTVRHLLIDKDFFARFLRIVLPEIQSLVYKSKNSVSEKKEENKKKKEVKEKKKEEKKEKKKEQGINFDFDFEGGKDEEDRKSDRVEGDIE